MTEPLVSIVIPTKNSLPHLKNAIEGVRKQTYRNFELIIQDAVSTDGTLEYLSTITDLPKIDIRSEPDSGLGQAYNRGISRCNGDYIFLTASDERIFDRTIEKVISWYKIYPGAAFIYGGMSLVDQQGKIQSTYIPSPFDPLKFRSCQVFLSFAGLLNRKVIGKELYYDESLKTSPDYDFFLRLSRLFSNEYFIRRTEILMSALCDRTSMSFRSESFEQFCKDKQFILDRFLPNQPNFEAKAGIFTWAARGVIELEGKVTPQAIQYCEQAESFRQQVDAPPSSAIPSSAKISVSKSNILEGVLRRIKVHLSKFALLERTLRRIKSFFSLDLNVPMSTTSKLPVRVTGDDSFWNVIVRANLDKNFSPDENRLYWVKIRMEVISGAVGICFFRGKILEVEKVFAEFPHEIVTYYPIRHPKEFSMYIRNNGVKNPIVEIHEVSVLQA